MFFKVIEDTEPGWWNDQFRDIPTVQCSCGRWKAASGVCLVCSAKKGVP